MKLIDTGQSFAEAHPILDTLTSPILFISAIIIIIIFIVIINLFMKKEISNNHKIIIIPMMLFVTLASIYLIIASFILPYKSSYEPTYTYHGDVKIINVSPMDEQGKREVTIKCDDTMRLLKLDDSDIDNVKKDNKATLEVKYNKKELTNKFFKNNFEKPKKHMNIKEMNNLRNAKIYKSNE